MADRMREIFETCPKADRAVKSQLGAHATPLSPPLRELGVCEPSPECLQALWGTPGDWEQRSESHRALFIGAAAS
jgi:hypothetical protein